ncbi:hypothetical protein NLM31_36810 [Bradyrhizobium sp. CCGUVB4N]|uniref:hypothetical protein n=1 Tax=Bradyrhizobium sp. CCGUVB4N TaxID=2949631 RepID=UPI0020B3586D|nr:hypothetical protein [Bradyrhizobium sp. CCGUVB4N]MCP3385964.1 hypothetical protein [Bradyrhizobium sp. CCGUVB4N]
MPFNPSRRAGRIDAMGFFLASVLAALAAGGVYAALHLGWFRSAWELGEWLVAGLAFLAVGLGIQGASAPRNANVHGTARPASEAEAQAVARGDTKLASLHDRTFPD